MTGWVIRTAWNIQFLPKSLYYPYVASAVLWLAAWMAMLLAVPPWMLIWGVLTIIYGLVLFCLSWRQAGVDCPEAQFALALVTMCLLPFIAGIGWLLCQLSKRAE